MVSVLIVEDSKISREALEVQLAGSGRYEVFAAIENAANAEIVCMRGQVQLILMDVCTAEDESGLFAASKIKEYYPEIRIIIMTSMPEHSFLQKAREFDCDGFWYKEDAQVSLLEVCDRVMRGERVFPQTSPCVKIGFTTSDQLSYREMEIIRELCMGHKYEDIADTLHISHNTVKYHVKNILQKTGYQNTLQLVAEVVGKRLVLPKFYHIV